MTIIEITSLLDLPRVPHIGYVCCPSAAAAAADHQAHYGVTPEVVYRFTNAIGRVTIYIPAPPAAVVSSASEPAEFHFPQGTGGGVEQDGKTA